MTDRQTDQLIWWKCKSGLSNKVNVLRYWGWTSVVSFKTVWLILSEKMSFFIKFLKQGADAEGDTDESVTGIAQAILGTKNVDQIWHISRSDFKFVTEAPWLASKHLASYKQWITMGTSQVSVMRFCI